ncbi:hypothetical protein ACP275_13G055000 [Erythranthe tilingii]
MADETVINGDFSNDRAVEITGEEEASSKISVLTQKITDLELENKKNIQQNEGYKQEIEELKASVRELSGANVEWKNKFEKAESEIKTLGSVAARAAELEIDVSRLHHDLVSAVSDLQENTVEVSNLKKELEGAKEREKDKDVKLEVIGKERDLLLAKVEKLEGFKTSLRDESDVKEKEIRGLKKKIEELAAIVDISKNLEKVRQELENSIVKMKGEITILENSLEEKNNVIRGFETKEREVDEIVNRDLGLNNGGEKKKGLLIGGLKQKDWVLVGGSTFATVAVMGVACYVHAAAKKH